MRTATDGEPHGRGVIAQGSKHDRLSRMDAPSENTARTIRARAARNFAKSRNEPPEANIRCPSCNRVMLKKNFARISGIRVDQCFDHGYWLDGGELKEVIEFVQEGGIGEARKRVKASARAHRRRARLERMRRRERQRMNYVVSLADIISAFM